MSDLPLFTRKADERIAELESQLEAEREKVRVLREATQLALESAESWIHDQLDGTSSLQSALAELQPVRNALQATAPEQAAAAMSEGKEG